MIMINSSELNHPYAPCNNFIKNRNDLGYCFKSVFLTKAQRFTWDQVKSENKDL